MNSQKLKKNKHEGPSLDLNDKSQKFSTKSMIDTRSKLIIKVESLHSKDKKIFDKFITL